MKSGARFAPAEALRLLVVLYASLPAILTLLGKGIQGGTHDGGDHLYRLLDLDVTFRSGVLFPRIAPHLASDYGYATFTFYSPFGVYLGEAFRLAGLGYIASLKTSFAASVLLAGVGAYLLARDLYGWRGGILAGVAYAYFPFLLVDIYTRGDLAEALAMGCLPFVFWSFRRLAGQPTPGRVIAAGVSYALLILCHNLTAFFATPVLLVFLLVSRRGRLTIPTVVSVGAGGFLALLLSAAYWLPVATGFGGLNPSAVTGGFFDYHKWFIPLSQLLQYHWAYDYRYAFEFGARFNAGRTIIVLAALATIWVVVARPAGYRFLLFGSGVLVVLLWLQTSSSVFVWDHIPPMRYLQFPYRLNAISGVPAVLLVGAFLARPLRPRFGSNWLILGRPAFGIIGSVLGVGVLFILPITSLAHLPTGHLDTQESEVNLPSLWRLELDRRLIASSTPGDYLPPTVPGELYQLLATMRAPIAAQRSLVELTAVQFEPLRLVANVQAQASGTLVFDRIADPVWTATLDGKSVTIGTTGPIGELTVAVPAGQHQLVLAAEETTSGRIGDVLSLVAAVVILAVIVGPSRPGWKKRLVLAVLLGAGAVSVIAPRIQPPQFLGVSANFGQAVRLVGDRVDRAPITPTGATDVTLLWETLQSPLSDCTVHLRLLDAQNNVVAERDKPPLFGLRSCATMPAGEVFRDVQQIRLPPGVPAGSYRLAVGLSVGQS
ncbi:MAG TPA: glycosyltransferase family 39 protein, partial [Chloroflexota bacterium]|nr:glycosyltransferase family 39 protein [Chloroflexota bacterium]